MRRGGCFTLMACSGLTGITPVPCCCRDWSRISGSGCLSEILARLGCRPPALANDSPNTWRDLLCNVVSGVWWPRGDLSPHRYPGAKPEPGGLLVARLRSER